jgi:hypothetical protein
VRIVGGRWSASLPSRLHINALELLAVAHAVQAFELRDIQINLHIDNRSALSHLTKSLTTPEKFWFSASKKFTSALLSRRKIVLRHVHWVASAFNPADAPSRGQLPEDGCTSASVELQDLAQSIIKEATASAW